MGIDDANNYLWGRGCLFSFFFFFRQAFPPSFFSRLSFVLFPPLPDLEVEEGEKDKVSHEGGKRGRN